MILSNGNDTAIIDSRDSLEAFFSIEEQYEQNICIKLIAYKAFVNSLYPTTGVDILLSKNIREDGRYSLPNELPWLYEGKIDADALIESLKGLAAPHCPNFTEEENAARIRILAEPVAYREEAALLYLFLLLHIQARHCLEETSMGYMAARLADVRQANYERNYIPRTEYSVPADQWRLVLPPCPEDSRCVQAIACSGLAVQVSLAGTPQVRTLFYQESVLTLNLAGKLPIFLPRSRSWAEDKDVQAYCARILRAYRTPPQTEETLLKPLLDEEDCAGWLTSSGSVITQDRVVAQGVLDAAAGDTFFCIALQDGIAILPRDGSTEPQYLLKTPVPVEEIDTHSGKIFWRRKDESSLSAMSLPHSEEALWH